MTILHAVLLVVLAAIWGASFVFIRLAAPAFGPLPLMATRMVIAVAALLAYVAFTRARLDLGRDRRRFIVLGAFNAAIPFALIATAELRLNASLASILNSTTPLFSVFVARIAFGATLRWPQVVGAVVGIGGVAALVGVAEVSGDRSFLLAVAASLAAALSYAIGASYAGRAFPGLRPLDLTLGQLVGAAVVLLPGALLTLPRSAPPPEAVGALLALAILGTVVGYLIYFRLIAAVGPTRTTAVTLLIPVFGVVFGSVFLGETPSASLLVGLVLVLAGVSLVTGAVAGPRPGPPSDGGAQAV